MNRTEISLHKIEDITRISNPVEEPTDSDGIRKIIASSSPMKDPAKNIELVRFQQS